MRMRIFISIFYFVRFMLYFYQGMNAQDQFALVKVQASVAIIETFNFIFFLWIWRPRKVWPEYFDWRVGHNQFGRLRNRNVQNDRNAEDPALQIKIQTAHITNRLLLGFKQDTDTKKVNEKKNKGSFGSDASFESFGSMDEHEPVIILNPNQYTQHEDDGEDFDRIVEADLQAHGG